ncbi:hypothetical protein C7444_12110 [Sphaerotilus hippei]|uniref:Uncharacterized protein n=1 Tax=Sphaerotilus hippei TaxID=744406 RepID=A0A318GVB3_9BURK|nr:hypothetical protein [Sphaerotilus hippei]PXW93246.1 hypothetical protein C7444_12110 [Sphaerotilus hippei]
MANVFASFATPNFAGRRDYLCDSALAVGFDRALRFSPDDYLGTDFATRNAETLALPRGAGYWLWKPWLIREALRGLNSGDLLVYCDAGRSDYYKLTRFPKKLSELARSNGHGFLLGPVISQHGPVSHWTKRDCLQIMGMDRPDVLVRPIIQATWSLWTPSDLAFSFLDQWLTYCEDSRCLADNLNVLGFDNHSGFRDHRHDQSILTLLAYKNNSPFLDFTSTGVFGFLGLRKKSMLANFFLKRIDDAENLLNRGLAVALAASLWDLKVKNLS